MILIAKKPCIFMALSKHLSLIAIGMAFIATSLALSCTNYWINPSTNQYECFDSPIALIPVESKIKSLENNLNYILGNTDIPLEEFENKNIRVKRSEFNSSIVDISFNLNVGKSYEDALHQMKSDIFQIVSSIPYDFNNLQGVEVVGWSLDTFPRLGHHVGIKISYTEREVRNIQKNKINPSDIIKQSSSPVWLNPI